ncbi:twin transmembrane helix small protein [Roseomonas sp. GC11]|uniref:twin transmembrane helix small protein n=1 Tax=Roseomonas sp. GC11 TaxID=2950546 RepID=UPI00210ECFF0|nr:twin transmembrane helix small protein [Roseomonas sp. GC11]MCQ4161433.1 twin transmembrane helix small protein [Roseomonas sp. GC11]
MQILLSILLGLAMLGTLGVLMAGMFTMGRGEDGGARSNRLMRWRVGLQGAAILLFVLLMLVMRG